MPDYSAYLLYTPRQIFAFRIRYAKYIAEQSDAYSLWINRFPTREWMDYLAGVPEQNIPVVIGVICILYIDGRINIDFNDSATRIRRNFTDEEFERYFV